MKEVIKKLQIKDGYVGKTINLPDTHKSLFTKWPAELLSNKRSAVDYVLVFVSNSKEIKLTVAHAAGLIRSDGLMLFAYPKKSSNIDTDISRDIGWHPLAELGYRPVRLISLDNT